jgi:hypothetical protein
MPEILTESFCERCGTRYTFESAAPTKAKKLGRFKTVTKGLKNYVMSDDTSLDEAMAAARSEDEQEQTAQQLDAFHSTFNFCMNCRQYTCGNCWNEVEGRCLTCSPHLGHEIMPAPFPEMPAPFPEMPAAARAIGLGDWPESDIEPQTIAAAAALETFAEVDPLERLDRLSTPEYGTNGTGDADALEAAEAMAVAEALAEPEESAAAGEFHLPVVNDDVADRAAIAAAAAALAESESEPAAAESVAEAVADESAPETAAPAVAAIAADAIVSRTAPEPVAAAAQAEPPPADEPADVDHRAAAAAVRTSALLAKFRPGQSIDAELEAYEASVAAEAANEPVVEPETLVAAAAAAAVVHEAASAEPELVAAEAEPEPVAAEVEPVAAEADQVEEQVEQAPLAAAAAVEAATPAPARSDVVEQPTWRIVAPDSAAPVTNGHAPESLPAAATAVPTPPPAPEAPPQWPVTPEWPQPNAALLAQRTTSPSAAMEALWVASARDVVAPAQGAPAGGVQPCNSCGLSLSANARFCRRCGTRQG